MSRNRVLPLLVVFAVALAMPATAQAAPVADHADTQAVLDRYLAGAGPGAAVHAGNRTHSWEVRTGTADVNAPRPLTSDDQFRIGSQTKTFTAVVVLQLVDEGKVDLDAPIERYLPGVVDGNGYDGTKISVRQILQHTSGISNDLGKPQADPDGTYRLRETIRAGLANPPQFPPGTGWGYSSVNFLVAGLLIEQITGVSAGDAITTRVIGPLGLTRTTYPRPGDRQLATPYLPGYVGGRSGPFFFWFDRTFAWELSQWATAGAIASTERDMAAFMRALVDGELVSPTTLAQLRATVPIPGAPAGMAYGLGLIRLDLSCGAQAWGHVGDTATGHSSATFATDDGRHAALVTNAFVQAEGTTTRIQVIDSALCGTP
ncbi:serine hydrolase domain-containing protein [Amycolatopsis pittospori]|uniref:serine hydrolase domain-containing protein n=1 Tax=Amycolatopsis pittospori TaxID=2749434 RepID=UPI002E28853F|nr:serine hydrolase domain-containing protein [Amycolatopsis pittospori]